MPPAGDDENTDIMHTHIHRDARATSRRWRAGSSGSGGPGEETIVNEERSGDQYIASSNMARQPLNKLCGTDEDWRTDSSSDEASE